MRSMRCDVGLYISCLSKTEIQVSIAKGSRLMICLNFSSNMHHKLNNHKVLTQSVHIAACFGGCNHHHRGIHLVG